MTFADISKIVMTLLASVGGGGAIVLLLSSYFGKIWANRLMAAERHEHQIEIEKLRAGLRNDIDRNLEELRGQVALDAGKRMDAYLTKVQLYRDAADLVTALIVDMAVSVQGGTPVPAEELVEYKMEFERNRLRAYSHIAMFAPQAVMDGFDNLIDHLMDIMDGTESYSFPEIRRRALAFLNEIRIDLAPDVEPIEYRGHR